MTTLKIKVPVVETRDWQTLEQVQKVFTDQEIVTMVHRYCDAQDHAKNYRVSRAAKVKAVMALAREHGLLE